MLLGASLACTRLILHDCSCTLLLPGIYQAKNKKIIRKKGKKQHPWFFNSSKQQFVFTSWLLLAALYAAVRGLIGVRLLASASSLCCIMGYLEGVSVFRALTLHWSPPSIMLCGINKNMSQSQLSIACYQESFYGNNYFELLPIVSSAFNKCCVLLVLDVKFALG